MTTPVIPTGIPSVNLTGHFIHADGSPVMGYLTLTMPQILYIPGAPAIAGGSVRVDLDANGAFSVFLIATDATAQSPSWSYRVMERFTGLPVRAYAIALPQAVTPVDIANATTTVPWPRDYWPVP